MSAPVRPALLLLLMFTLGWAASWAVSPVEARAPRGGGCEDIQRQTRTLVLVSVESADAGDQATIIDWQDEARLSARATAEDEGGPIVWFDSSSINLVGIPR